MYSFKITKVTALLHPDVSHRVIDQLHAIGVGHIHFQDARTPSLARQRNPLQWLTGGRSLFPLPIKAIVIYHEPLKVYMKSFDNFLNLPCVAPPVSAKPHRML